MDTVKVSTKYQVVIPRKIRKDLALDAAIISVDEGLRMSDSMLLATAKYYGAVLWTQDVCRWQYL